MEKGWFIFASGDNRKSTRIQQEQAQSSAYNSLACHYSFKSAASKSLYAPPPPPSALQTQTEACSTPTLWRGESSRLDTSGCRCREVDWRTATLVNSFTGTKTIFSEFFRPCKSEAAIKTNMATTQNHIKQHTTYHKCSGSTNPCLVFVLLANVVHI